MLRFIIWFLYFEFHFSVWSWKKILWHCFEWDEIIFFEVQTCIYLKKLWASLFSSEHAPKSIGLYFLIKQFFTFWYKFTLYVLLFINNKFHNSIFQNFKCSRNVPINKTWDIFLNNKVQICKKLYFHNFRIQIIRL